MNNCIYCGQEVELEEYEYYTYHGSTKIKCTGKKIKDHSCEIIKDRVGLELEKMTGLI